MSEKMIEIKNLKKYFKVKNGLLHAVDDLSFFINKGETLGLVGESGCGKSTTGRTIIRLLEANSGQVLMEGENILDYNKKKLNKYDKAYLRIAREWSLLSYCKRKQVGAIIVKDRMIISDGYNGTPSGFDNCCEDDEGLTRWDVLHAEANAILKVARSTQSCEGATLYITLSPCKECSKLIHQSGIKRVVYQNGYRDDAHRGRYLFAARYADGGYAVGGA